MYEVRISNKYSFGSWTIYGETIQQIKDELKKLYIDKGATVKLYEVKEIPIDSDWYEILDKLNVGFKEEIYRKIFYDQACILKKHCVDKREILRKEKSR